MPPRMLAAMAMSPLAALSLPLVQNESWQSSARDFGAKVREKLQQHFSSEGFKEWARGLDENLTFMDWTYKHTGIDLSYIWDPELWVKFKEAVWEDEPSIFWNKLIDRIEYKSLIPQQGLAGDMRISYSKFLQLLETNRVKRVVVYGDMKTAIVEVPHPWTASVLGAPGTYPFVTDRDGQPINLVVPNPAAPDDPLQWYCPEMPEWNMEKYRFYVDLPGDFWERGALLRYLRSRDVAVVWDEESGQYLLPHSAFNKVFQVRTEVQVLDPAENWDFVAWFTSSPRLELYEQAAAVALFCRGLTLTCDWATGTPVWRMWSTRKKKKKSKEESTWERLTRSTAREFMTKDAKTGKVRDTGVRFADIAGLDHIVVEMREVVKMLLGDELYTRVGAKVPRGIIFQGPPGTGKTYMARAIAGEAGVAFFSSVGSEFVEMFAGIAAARVNNLFVTARKRAPAIIFIDEIDAIGRARSTLGSDPGSMERESALLAMLVQMDGIHGKLESVLTIGATNLAQDLDQALLRPGRFEVVYEIPNPGPVGRLEILRYHARNKQLESDGLLTKVAEVTNGWSAASLANLMNEAAILTVRRSVPKITLPLVLDLVEGSANGLPGGRLPPSEAKNRLALVTAAKAVAFALTPGLERIKFVSLWGRRQGAGPVVEFEASEGSLDPAWHPEQVDIMDWATRVKVNAATTPDQPLGEFRHVAGLLVPLYTPRAAEVAFFGPDGASLATAPPLSDCFEIGYYCVRNSMTHPRFRHFPPLHTFAYLGEDGSGANQRDPLAVGFDEELGYHSLTLTLLKASWRRAERLVATRRTAIVALAEELLKAENETVSGERLVALIEATPEDAVPEGMELHNEFMPLLREVLGRQDNTGLPRVIIEGEAAAPDVEAQRPAAQKQLSAPAQEAAPAAASPAVASTSFRGAGSASFTRRPAAPAAAEAAPASAPPPPPPEPVPELVVSAEAVGAVSRALMGHLDIVDLVGRNTAEEVAERVREALAQPGTAERLAAVRKWVEVDGAPFPPPPLLQDIPLPADGQVDGPLSSWQPRADRTVSWSAMEMLFTRRQLKYFKQDADTPRDEDSSQYKKRQAQQGQEAGAKSE